MVKKERSSFRIKDTSPHAPSQADIALAQLQAIRSLQVAERAEMGVDEVEVEIRHNRPIMVLTLGDLHIGSIATNHDKIVEVRDMVLSNPDICVVLLGDEIEGMVGKYLDTNSARTPIDVRQQIELFREIFLKPLAEEDRILGMVTGYFGHPGWAQDASTINPWKDMVEGYDIPLIRNGGVLHVRFENGHQQSMRIFHNSPGKSQMDPVFGLRKALIAESLPSRPSMAAGGHWHRAGIEKVYAPADANTNSQPQAMITLNSGTTKGADGVPDRFGVKLGLPPADPVGQGVVLSPRRRSGPKLEKNYPVMTYEHGQIALSALELLNSLESQGMTEEMEELIHSEVEMAPDVVFNTRRSRQLSVPYNESPDETNGDEDKYHRWHQTLVPQYSRAHYDIDSQLPVAIDLMANIRTGSNSEGYAAAERYIQSRLGDNPHALVAFLRNIVDQDVAKDPERKAILDKVIALGAQFPEQVVAIMHDGNLRRSEWKKGMGEESIYSPIAAGSYLSEGLGAPLISHHSVLQFAVGPKSAGHMRPHYTMLTLDSLDQHGSQYRPMFGHGRVYDLYTQSKPGMVVGGHMPGSGFNARFDRSNPETDVPFFVAPGWWAKTVDSLGRRNTRPGAIPGQSVILMPGESKDDYMVFPTSNPEETQYMHDALLLWRGLQILNMQDAVQA